VRQTDRHTYRDRHGQANGLTAGTDNKMDNDESREGHVHQSVEYDGHLAVLAD